MGSGSAKRSSGGASKRSSGGARERSSRGARERSIGEASRRSNSRRMVEVFRSQAEELLRWTMIF